MSGLKTWVKVTLGILAAGVVGGGIMVINSNNADAGNSGIKIPEFVGKEKSVVENWIASNKIDEPVKYTYEFNEEYEKDIIISQSQKAGQMYKTNEAFEITLSKGFDPDKEFELPDFTGKNKDELQQWFEKNHFSDVIYIYSMDTEEKKDTFLSMDPACGKIVKRDVQIMVTLAGVPVTAPDFSGMTIEEIENWAKENGVELSIIKESDPEVAEGRLISVSVNKGDVITSDMIVTVYVSTGSAAYTEEINQQQTNTNPSSGGAEYVDPDTVSSQGSSSGFMDAATFWMIASEFDGDSPEKIQNYLGSKYNYVIISSDSAQGITDYDPSTGTITISNMD